MLTRIGRLLEVPIEDVDLAVGIEYFDDEVTRACDHRSNAAEVWHSESLCIKTHDKILK